MNTMEALPIERFAPIASILFVAGFLLILGLIWDMFRRGKEFPAIQHGRIVIPGRLVRWLWVFGLVASYVAGGRVVVYSYYEENGVRQPSPVAIDAVPFGVVGEQSTVESRSGMTNLPFYESTYNSVVYRDGQSRSAANHRVVIPAVFFLLVAAYLWMIRGQRGPGGYPPKWIHDGEPRMHGA